MGLSRTTGPEALRKGPIVHGTTTNVGAPQRRLRHPQAMKVVDSRVAVAIGTHKGPSDAIECFIHHQTMCSVVSMCGGGVTQYPHSFSVTSMPTRSDHHKKIKKLTIGFTFCLLIHRSSEGSKFNLL
jgi:hypothetical protein